jgi:transcription elongation factor GreA
MPQEEYLTKEKFDSLSRELDFLKTAKRKEIAENLEYAKSLGDLSENQEYHDARDTQAITEDRINRLESILKNAKIVSTHGNGEVVVGSVITVEKSGDKAKRAFTIVGSEEADATEGKISVHSPLGRAAMGKKKGESFSITTPNGTMIYKITDIK